MLKKTLFLILLCGFSGFSQQQLSTAETEKLKTELRQVVNSINSLTGDFTQIKSVEFMEDDVESSGKFFYQEPKQIKWKYEQPLAYSIRFLEDKILLSQQGNTQEVDANSNALLKQLSEFLSESITGKILESDAFTITYFKHNGTYSAQLNPNEKELKEVFSRIILHFEERYLINKIELIDPNEDTTIIELNNVKLNTSLEQNTFKTP
ncbi:LolA family protein [Mesonia aquimarina]|uniref:LolA family protein n=1 Tax=Mesonia aquimarina TaxID=1504967 RepID=UPI000EF62D2D|nr:outer membrane lipoprotein carrier protein LolA [Mesonia aquimarina]